MGGRRFVAGVGGSRWLGWVVAGCRGSFGDRVVVVVAAADLCQLYAPCKCACGEHIPEAGTGAGSHSNAGWDDDGCCTPAAMAPLAAVVDRNPACSLAVANVVAEVVAVFGLGRSWRCMEVVGHGCLEGEEESFALRRSSRLLPCWRMCYCGSSCSNI